MARTKKSKPFAVRLPPALAEWVETYAREQGLSKSEVFERAVRKLRRMDGRRFNGKKQTLLETIRGIEDGTKHSQAQ